MGANQSLLTRKNKQVCHTESLSSQHLFEILQRARIQKKLEAIKHDPKETLRLRLLPKQRQLLELLNQLAKYDLQAEALKSIPLQQWLATKAHLLFSPTPGSSPVPSTHKEIAEWLGITPQKSVKAQCAVFKKLNSFLTRV